MHPSKACVSWTNACMLSLNIGANAIGAYMQVKSMQLTHTLLYQMYAPLHVTYAFYIVIF